MAYGKNNCSTHLEVASRPCVSGDLQKKMFLPKITKVVVFRYQSGPNLMALLTAEVCAYDHDSPLTCKRRISALAYRTDSLAVAWLRCTKSVMVSLTLSGTSTSSNYLHQPEVTNPALSSLTPNQLCLLTPSSHVPSGTGIA